MDFETIFIGIVVALLYAEVTGVYPGGIIVPAFLAVSLNQPARVLSTILIACLSLFVYKMFARYFILFGRRRFVLMLLLGGLWAQAWLLLVPSLYSGPPELRAIGWIIPGLLANNLEKQKFLPTLASLATVVVLTYFLANLVKMIG
ncbi:MAG: poly-gamma-glutamate biosynthesis protein PgsC [Clostridiales bacterium]|nr:poly-gamma-glutamate biosynthesis protein PgsC [Clostridiales bacterium]